VIRGTDWLDLHKVIAYAKILGAGQVVYKHPERRNYNVTHVTRTDIYRREWVVFKT
jgi:hypothetical protein